MKDNKKRFRITEITGWESDKVSCVIKGDGVGLPFMCEADTLVEAMEKYTERFYKDAPVKPAKCVGVEVFPFTVSLQVDCRVDVVVYDTDAERARHNAVDIVENGGVSTESFEVLEAHGVYAEDRDGNRTELCE